MIYRNLRNNEIVGLSGLALLIMALFFISKLINFEAINHYIEQAGIWAPVIFILAKASTVFFAPISGSPLYFLVGTLFGLTEGIFYAFIGDLIGFSLIFFVSRKYGLKLIKKIIGEKDKRLLDIIYKNTKDIKSFVKMAALFFWFPEMVIAATALSRMSYFKIMIVFMPVYTIGASLFIFISTIVLSA